MKKAKPKKHSLLTESLKYALDINAMASLAVHVFPSVYLFIVIGTKKLPPRHRGGA